MQVTALLRDDAVSPVIGVILMVAITVILAAVIGTFVLGLGDEAVATSPQASFTFDFDGASSPTTDCGDVASASGGDTGKLTVTHDGGDGIEAGRLSVSSGASSTGLTGCGFGSPSEISAGTTFSAEVNSADTVRVVWESSNGGDTATLGKWTGPDA